MNLFIDLLAIFGFAHLTHFIPVSRFYTPENVKKP